MYCTTLQQMSGFGEIIKKIRESKGLTPRQLAKASDVSNEYIYKIENGSIQKMGMDKVIAITNVLGDEAKTALLPFFQESPLKKESLKEIPLLSGTVSASTFTHSFNDWEGEMITVPIKNIKNKVAWKIQGHSMEAPDGSGYSDGDVVILDNSVQFSDGDHVVAENDTGVTIKELKILKDGQVELRPLNPEYPTLRFKNEDKLEILGVVVGSYKERRRKRR